LHFLNPIMLLGLAAAVVPLAIHLLHQGRARPLPFSNLEFLRRLHHSRMRRVRLRQWLILLLRTLIILLITAAFARPAYQSGAGGWGGSSVPTAAALLLDRSYSTTYRLPTGRLFEQLQAQVLAALDLFDNRDKVLLIPFASRPTPLENASDDKTQLQDQVKELLPTEESTDLEKALQSAARYLVKKQQSNREVFLFTDLAQHNWSEVGDQRDWLPNTTVYIGVPEITERANIHIDDVRISSWMPASGNKLTVQVSLTNSSTQGATGTFIDLYIDGERVRRQEVNPAPGEQVQVDLFATPRRAGHLTGYVEIEDDDLPLDNRRYFALNIPEKINLLILGNQPSDLYFPRRALTTAALSDPTLNIGSGFLDDLDAAVLQGVDVLLLCNLQRLNDKKTALLHKFVAAGGGLIVFPSPQADLNFYNRDLLPGLLPALFKEVLGNPTDRAVFQLLDPDRPHHLLFEGLLRQKPEDQPRFYASFELAPKDNLQPLIYFADGHLALASAWKERGRTVLFAVPISADWNDLPIKGLFVPLLHRLTRFLSLPSDHRASYQVGQTVHRYLDATSIESTITAESPGGNRLLISPERVEGRYYWKIPQVDESGLWRLLKEGEVVDRFPVNLDSRESVLTPVGRDRLQQIFGAERTHFIQPGDNLREEVLGRRYGRELWRECLMLALVLLLLELWVARRPHGRFEGAAARTAA
jgi:hypothetical protein